MAGGYAGGSCAGGLGFKPRAWPDKSYTMLHTIRRCFNIYTQVAEFALSRWRGDGSR